MTLEEAQKDLLGLRKRRGVIKGSLTRIKTFVRCFDINEQPMSLLEFRQDELPQINRKFDDVQSQIELLSDDITQENEERNSFEIEYYSIRSQIKEIVNVQNSQPTTLISNQSLGVPHYSNRARLPPISLPTFDGNIQEWESFFDFFKAAVHNEDAYPPAQKFSYLRSSLVGVALDVIRAIPMTEANYDIALKRLKQRYENKSMIIQSHIRAILDCPQVESTTAGELQSLHSRVASHTAALEALGQPVVQWDAWLVTIILRKLDHATAQEWQLRRKDTELPTYKELEEFLASRCVALESTEAFMNKNELKKKTSINHLGKRVTLAAIETKPEKCACCSQTHRIYACKKFKDLPQSERFNVVRSARMCFNCLSSYHMAPQCQSNSSCQVCRGKHNTLLHFEKSSQGETSGAVHRGKPQDEDDPVNSEQSGSDSTQAHSYIAARPKRSHIFLSTAEVLVTDSKGCKRKCRAVLDSGSMINFASRSLLNALQLPTKKTELPIRGVGASQIQSVALVNIQVGSRVGKFQARLPFYVLPTVVGDLPSCPTPRGGWDIPQDLISKLADTKFYEAGTVDLLIGAEIFYQILERERIPLRTNSLTLQDSKFGWIVTGRIDQICLINMNTTPDSDASYGKTSKANQRAIEEKQALQHFQNTVTRNYEGRFVLQLPVKSEVRNLGQSVNMATSRFMNIEARLQRDSTLRTEYLKFMKEYLAMGHMRLAPVETRIPERAFYLPHHAVFKSSSLTTKTRIVFDASAKTTTGLSLNDVLMRGPTTQDDIFSILTRFRKHQYVITADIEKMFRQISVAEQDWDLQRILWRSDPSEALRTYQLVTVTYGTTPASFMSTQCLISLAQDMKKILPRASETIIRDFYMDDLMTGGETQEECVQLHKEIISILDSARLPLRKWCSNSSQVLKQIGKDVRDPLFTLDIGDDETIKSLGLSWTPCADDFRFYVTRTVDVDKVTKRTLLSDLNKVFDPLGFLAPVIIKGKIFLQQLWQLKIDWDTPLQDDIKQRWQQYYTQIEDLKDLSIPRKAKPGTADMFELHGFCDASIEAYGACVYVRYLGPEGKWQSRLLCSKTRVAPLKSATIPRLELSGALLLVQLSVRISQSWGIDVKQFKLWSDSMVVLGWLNSESSRLKTYVANRVEQILDGTDVSQWRYINTKDNPADIISRGIDAQELARSAMWWNGPSYLSLPEIQWSHPTIKLTPCYELPEQRPIKLVLVAIEESMDIINAYSNWRSLVRAIAWLSRFSNYLKNKRSIQVRGFLTLKEIKSAEVIILKRAQNDAFHDELKQLNIGRDIARNSPLKTLNPFLKDGLILVGGRLQNSNLRREQRHPVVLPYNHKITRLIFQTYHQKMLHCGPQLLLSEIRNLYWPLKGRLVARSTTLHCVQCTRAKPTFQIPLMAPLPKQRVQCSRPFTITGVDFAGPLTIRSGVRGRANMKAWIALFICFVTKAIHIEVVEDLTSNSFIATLRRFMSRRGKPTEIWSDNGTNFVGAQRELASYLKNIEGVSVDEGFTWHFNPPSAPHFGGLWESAVKSAKYHLTRVLKETKLTLIELQTLLCQIEACLNSRPITPMSNDPNDLQPLTPAHFLIGGPMLRYPEPDLSQEQGNGLRRWRFVQFLMQDFWKRWHEEYLPQLQTRGKWTSGAEPFKVNDIVIIKEENTPPMKWRLARIVQVHPGTDGRTRVVTIHMANGLETRRPVAKLCRLPIESEETVEK